MKSGVDSGKTERTKAFFNLFKIEDPFHWWRPQDKKESIRLIEEGIDLNAQDEKGDTPLHVAVRYPLSEVEIIKLLVEKGANVNARNKEGETPLHVNSSTLMILLIANSEAINEKIKYLLSCDDVDINTQNADGDTLLNKAVCVGYDSTVELLLNNKAKISISDHNGDVPLEYLTSSEFHVVVSTGKFFLSIVLEKIKSVGRLGYLTEAFDVILNENWDLLFNAPEKMFTKIRESDEKKREKIIKLIGEQYDNAVEMGIAKEYQPSQLLNRLLNNVRYTAETTEMEPMPVASKAILHHPRNNGKDEILSDSSCRVGPAHHL